MNALAAKPYCGLCGDLKFEIRHKVASGVWACSHCDMGHGCKGFQCGACRKASEKTYPRLEGE